MGVNEAGSMSPLSAPMWTSGAALESLVKEKFPFLSRDCAKVDVEVAAGFRGQNWRGQLGHLFLKTS